MGPNESVSDHPIQASKKTFTAGNRKHIRIIILSLLTHIHRPSSTSVKHMKERIMTKQSAMKNSMSFPRTQHFKRIEGFKDMNPQTSSHTNPKKATQRYAFDRR